MFLGIPAAVIPPEKPAIIRAHDLKGLPTWEEMDRRDKALREGTFPFPFVPPKSSGFTGTTTFTGTTSGVNNLANLSVRVIIGAAALTTSGTQVRVTVRAGSAGTAMILDDMYIGVLSGTMDFASAPTQITWDTGNAGTGSVALNATKQSDIITFTLNEAVDHLISFHVNNSTSDDVSENSVSSCSSKFKNGASESATVDVVDGGYSSNANIWAIALIEV